MEEATLTTDTDITQTEEDSQHIESGQNAPIPTNIQAKNTDGLVNENVMVDIKVVEIDVKDDIDPKAEVDSEFDAYCNDGNIFRKYKTRKRQISQDSSKIECEPDIYYDDIDLSCSTCHKVLPTRKGLINHMRIHITKRIFKCALCAETFKTNKELVDHKVHHDDEGQKYKCEKCEEDFTDHCEFLIHTYSHTNQKTHKCLECGGYYSLSRIKCHIPTHYSNEVKCPQCDLTLQQYRLQAHINSKHKHKKQCVECGKVCTNNQDLRYHMSSHTGVKLFQCLYCGRGFGNTAQRKVHTMIHTGEKKHECDICGHKSVQKSTHDKHLLTHLSEKVYECDYCQKKFFRRESLLPHMRAHMKTELYYCKLCPHTTSTRTGLRTHTLYKHTSKYDYECDPCKTKFKTSMAYKRHMLSISHRNRFYEVYEK